MLLRLAGTLPDDMISRCRSWLSDGRRLDVARTVTAAATSTRLALTELDVCQLEEELTAAGLDASALSTLDDVDMDWMPTFEFSARGEPVGATSADGADRQDVGLDELERAAVTAVRAEYGTVAIWRSWRTPADGSPWPPPRRVWIVEVAEQVDLVGLTGRVQSALAAAGEDDPQVELYPTGAQLPTYQRFARAYGCLLWADRPDPEIRLARLFDGIDPPAGPSMAPDHPVVEGEQLARLLDYLRRGEPVLLTTALTNDVVDTSKPANVPMNFVTDGNWIWNDAATYYLDWYGLLPDPELVAHIAGRGYQFPTVNGADLHRALAFLQQPDDQGPG
jgi:hypothetical protein